MKKRITLVFMTALIFTYSFKIAIIKSKELFYYRVQILNAHFLYIKE